MTTSIYIEVAGLVNEADYNLASAAINIETEVVAKEVVAAKTDKVVISTTKLGIFFVETRPSVEHSKPEADRMAAVNHVTTVMKGDLDLTVYLVSNGTKVVFGTDFVSKAFLLKTVIAQNAKKVVVSFCVRSIFLTDLVQHTDLIDKAEVYERKPFGERPDANYIVTEDVEKLAVFGEQAGAKLSS